MGPADLRSPVVQLYFSFSACARKVGNLDTGVPLWNIDEVAILRRGTLISNHTVLTEESLMTHAPFDSRRSVVESTTMQTKQGCIP